MTINSLLYQSIAHYLCKAARHVTCTQRHRTILSTNFIRQSQSIVSPKEVEHKRIKHDR